MTVWVGFVLPWKDKTVTKKDYIGIAKIISEAKDVEEDQAVAGTIAYKLCAVFLADNPRFDRARFLEACK